MAQTEEQAHPPSVEALRAALRDIDATAQRTGILQAGAAYALGALAEACCAAPGATWQDIADAVTATSHG